MQLTKRDEQRRDRISDLALGLPEATATPSGRPPTHTTFFVRKQKFAYHLVDHHGDVRVSLQVRAAPGRNAALAEADERYFMPQYMAHHGWVGLWLDLPKVDWNDIEALLVASYRIQAPKTLVKLLDA